LKTLGNRAGQKEILYRLAKLSQLDQGKWGRMSVHQMVCHLADGYRVALGERSASPATGLLQRTLLKWIALWLPLKWIKGYPTRPEIEQGRSGSLPTAFGPDKESLIMILKRFCQDLPEPCLPHPVFGEMTAKEWLRWGYLHADHHLRQFGH
jgi:Protein of unknown function (DUF1569)